MASVDASREEEAADAGPGPEGPRIKVTFEPAFRLDQRILPREKAAQLEDLKDRTLWNRGALGTTIAPVPPLPDHPLPRVIVDVTRVAGPHKQADVQAVLRKLFWAKVVECYGLAAYKNPSLRGAVSLAVGISAKGKVRHARIVAATLKANDVTACLAEKIRSIALPKAKAASGASVEVHIGPGDEPMPPPQDRIVPGNGELASEAIAKVIEDALPTFEACYRPSLTYAPELFGRLGIRFHLTERGYIDEAFEVESRFPDERVTLCVLRAARKLTFPKPASSDLRFIVPLRFWNDRSPVPEPR